MQYWEKKEERFLVGGGGGKIRGGAFFFFFFGLREKYIKKGSIFFGPWCIDSSSCACFHAFNLRKFFSYPQDRIYAIAENDQDIGIFRKLPPCPFHHGDYHIL